jgi:hypothetical protein
VDCEVDRDWPTWHHCDIRRANSNFQERIFQCFKARNKTDLLVALKWYIWHQKHVRTTCTEDELDGGSKGSPSCNLDSLIVKQERWLVWLGLGASLFLDYRLEFCAWSHEDRYSELVDLAGPRGYISLRKEWRSESLPRPLSDWHQKSLIIDYLLRWSTIWNLLCRGWLIMMT